MGIYDPVRNDDAKDHKQWLRNAMTIVFLFLVSGCYSWDEVRYSMSGVKTSATVTEVIEAPSRSNQRRVTYHFNDNAGQQHRGKLALLDSQAAEVIESDNTMQVIYLPNAPDTHEPVKMRNFWAVGIFLFMCLVMIAYIGRIYFDVKREAAQDNARKHGH